jgi:DNA-binding CsgD family transcriptional regulator
MGNVVLDRLTGRQLECLRLAARPMTSKEIARELAISPRTVEGHLDKAVQLLGAGSRIEAVRMLGELENPRNQGQDHSTYNLRTYPQTVADDGRTPTMAPPNDTDAGAPFGGDATGAEAFDRRGETDVMVSMREHQLPFHSSFAPPDMRFPLPFPRKGRRINDLTMWQRVGWTFAIVIGLALATGFLLSSLSGISAVARSLSH